MTYIHSDTAMLVECQQLGQQVKCKWACTRVQFREWNGGPISHLCNRFQNRTGSDARSCNPMNECEE